MKTKVVIEYYDGFDINKFDEKLRDLSREKNRDWYYDELVFNHYGNAQGEIIISYKDYADSVFPHANVILGEIELINDSFIKIKEVSDIK